MKKIIIALILASGCFCSADNCVWIGESGNWNDAANWENSKIPGENDTAVFTGDKVKKVTIKNASPITSLQVDAACTAKLYLKCDLSLKEDFILKGGKFYAGKCSITVGRNFTIKKNNFVPSTSTVILKGTGTLKVARLNRLVVAFPNQTVTLPSSIILASVELNGGILEGKGGIKFYTHTPVLKGGNKSSVNIAYISFRPSKACTIELPEIKINSYIYFESHKVKTTFLINKALYSNKNILIYGSNGGLASVEINGGEIHAEAIKIGVKNQDRLGQLKIISGKIELKRGIYVNNEDSLLTYPKEFELPKVNR